MDGVRSSKESQIVKTFVRSFCVVAVVLAGASLVATPSYAKYAKAALAADQAADAALSEKVKTQIDAEPSLKDSNISVTSRNGVVTLKGDIDSPMTRMKVVETARGVEGVTKVVNKILITKKK